MNAHRFLKMARQTHLYLGMFTAPAILFFAFTGVLQTFSLHESAKDGAYKPAKWIVVLAQIHKKQTMQLPQAKAQPSAASLSEMPTKKSKPVSSPQAAVLPASNPLPLKLFFLIVGIGLGTSTASGLYMSYKYCRNKLLLTVLFLAGIFIPVILTLA
ncbi:MAG TPA: PepSY domain-containing protein [Acidobacteriaceae bacterium]|jgi:hypothetical protein